MDIEGKERVTEVLDPTAGAPPSDRPLGEDPLTHVLVLRLDGREYALPVHRVLEIVRMVAVTPLPGAPAWIDGVVNLRGRIVPVIDLRARLGIPRREPDLSTPIVMIQGTYGIFGLVTDALVEVLTLSPDDVDANSEQTAMSPSIAATARHGDRLILVLDADRLHDRSLEAFLPTGTAAASLRGEPA